MSVCTSLFQSAVQGQEFWPSIGVEVSLILALGPRLLISWAVFLGTVVYWTAFPFLGCLWACLGAPGLRCLLRTSDASGCHDR